MAKSFPKSYRYLFNIPPAFHGEDIGYTFYTGPNPAVVNETTAIIHQKFITNYVTRGEPGCAMGVCFPGYANYGGSANALSVNVTEIKVVKDPSATEKCDFQVRLTEFS